MEGQCKRCHRTLSNKTSVIDGYGPVCYEKLFGHKITVRKKKEPQNKITKIKKPDKDIFPPMFNVEEMFP